MDEERRLHLQIAAAFLVIVVAGIAYFVWRGWEPVSGVRVVTSAADVASCSFVANLAVQFETGLELTRTPQAEMRDAELILRRQALEVAADVLLITTDAGRMSAQAFRCSKEAP